MEVIELFVEDLGGIAGVDAIALVEKPAHLENWMAFNSEMGCSCQSGKETEEDFMVKKAEEWGLLGETHEQQLEEGFELVSIRKISTGQFAVGNINSTPNEPSYKDYAGTRIRYKYVGPQDRKNRDFCAAMMRSKRVYRMEDILRMTEEIANPDFGAYSIFDYRGSFNCRHYWVELIYKSEGRILNDADRKRDLIGSQEIINFPTETRATAAARDRRERLSLVQVVNGMGLFDNPEEASKMAEIIGCKGYHEMVTTTGHKLYMPCENHGDYNIDTTTLQPYISQTGTPYVEQYSIKETFESYTDYPEAAKENACKVLRWIDEHGREEVDAMTQVGITRANQLCKGEAISEETIARMSSFERHRNNSGLSPEYQGTPWKDRGYVSWLAWGGDEGIAWASRKLDQIREEMLWENPCQDGYVAYGTKIKDGREVPNCIAKEQQTFSYNDDKMEITGAAMIPNKLIVRQSFGEPYYVYFSEETIRLLQQKFMENRLLDKTNIEHIDSLKANSYVKESWIVEDPTKDKAYALGLEYPKGTWMVTMKVNDPSVWKNIKQGKLNGFSIEGFFDERRQFSEQYDTQLELIKTIIKQISYDEQTSN